MPEVVIRVPTRENALLERVVALVNANEEIKTLWRVINVNAVDRLGMSDHGPVHFQIVANIGLRLLRILVKHNVQMSISKNYNLPVEYAEVVVFLGCALHDLGMSINREGHEEFSLILAYTLLREILGFLPTPERVIVTSEVLHAIISHRSSGKPITVEAGIVRVADALDMSQGRSRIPYEAGAINIHSLSASAIDSVEIAEGSVKPIQINISMNNSSGIFQVDELLKEKLAHSGIEQHFEIKATIQGETEKKLLSEFHIASQ